MPSLPVSWIGRRQVPALAFCLPALARSQGSEAPPAAAISLSPDIPVRRDSPSADRAGIQAWGMLLLLLLVALGTVYAVRRARRRPAGIAGVVTGDQGVQKVATTRLDTKHVLHEVHWRDEALLISSGEQGVCVLARSPLTPRVPREST